MSDKFKRRWFRFSLRGMLVTMILASVGFGWWVQQSREWLRQRHEWMDTRGGVNHFIRVEDSRAPGGLWLFGEEGAATVAVAPGDELEAKRLFPEAEVVIFPATLTGSGSQSDPAVQMESSSLPK